MKNKPVIAAAATILLHAALLAASITGLTVARKPDTEPLRVELLVPVIAPPRIEQPALQRTVPVPQPSEKKPVEPKPRPQNKPLPQPRADTSPQRAPEAPPEPGPLPSTSLAASPASVATAPATPAPAAPAPPARTSASEASYASSNRTPPYPRLALSNGEEGTVVLRVLVTAEGTAGAVEIRTSSGYPLLDESARRTVQTWRFKPATVDGKPVAEWYQVPIPFKLQNN